MASQGPSEDLRSHRDPERGRLSREAIVDTAIRLIEAEGEAAASMRRISAELGVAAMSLYNHIPSKAALLDAVGEHVRAQITLPDAPGLSWEERARELVRAFRDVVQRFPNCMQLSMARAPHSLVGLEPLEFALDMAHQAGFRDHEAIRVVRAFVSYAVGTINTAANRARAMAALGDVGVAFNAAEGLPADRFPHVTALGPALLENDDEADFEFGLDLLIRAVTELLSETGDPR